MRTTVKALGLAVALLALASPALPASAAVDPASQLITCDRAADRVTITASSHLDPSCTYTGGFDIKASNVVFDCQGALISKVGSGRGIEISTDVDSDMSGVTVRNCRVEGFLNSIRVTRIGFRGLAAGHEFDHTLQDVTIEDSELSSSRGVGLYVDGYVSGVTVRNLHIHDAGSTGIYLEAGSKDNVVEDSDIIHNGYTENSPAGQLTMVGGSQFRFWGTGREGIAVDGSSHNVIRGNRFEGNSAGGIFLYTNCGEYVHQKPDTWFERRSGAEHNLIEGNDFTGGVNGVFVGARMAENTYPMDCSQASYLESPFVRYVLDRAAHNTVQDNAFHDVTYGVRVEDDDTTVAGNAFDAADATHHAVIIGTPKRTQALGLPVSGTTVTGNVAQITGNRHPYRWVDGEVGTTFSHNESLGQEVGLCQGTPLPYNPFVMTLAVAYEPPGSPVTPTPPNLAWPTVGVMPSCDPAVPPVIEPGSASVTEGNSGTTTVELPVHLSEPSVNTVTARWTTVEGGPWARATVGSGPDADVSAATGTVTFLPGQTDATVAVEVRGDAIPEPDEVAMVRFDRAVNATVGGFFGRGTVVIADDDPLVVITPGSARAAESAGVVEIPVTLDHPAAQTVSAHWSTIHVAGAPAGQATPDDDYQPSSGTVTFAPGQTSATVAVPLVVDGLAEGDEYVVVSFSDPVDAQLGGFWGLGFGTIADG